MCSIYMNNILSYLSTFRVMIQQEDDINKRRMLYQKLSFLESFRIINWNEQLQKKYVDFIDFIDHKNFNLFTKIDLMLTSGIMMNQIPMMQFDQYSDEALLLCSSVMRHISYDDYGSCGSLLCNKQIVGYVMKFQTDLNEQLRIYQDSIDGCVTCLCDFIVSLDLKKIVNDEKLYNGIILIMKQIVDRYISYMNLSEGEIQHSLRRKCEYGIR